MSKYIDIDSKLNTENYDLRLATDIEAINNSLSNIITTQKYTVPGDPSFGCDLEQILFEVLDDITFSLIEDSIIVEINKREPRVDIVSIEFTPKYDFGQLFVNIVYKIAYNNEIVSTVIKLDVV